MLIFAVRRLGTACIVVWLALTLAFVVLRWVPGDALDATLKRAGVPEEDITARRDELGLNDPMAVQYVAYLAGLVQGDLGESLISGLPVSEIITANFRATAELAGSALLVAVVLGIGLGCVAGIANRRLLQFGAEVIASLMLSTPVYWTATLAIYVFTIELDWLPGVGGRGLRYMILPACVLGFHAAGSIAQVTASSMRETIQQDFVRTAWAKGLPGWAVLSRHVLRVGLLSVVAVIALQIGFLLGGTVVTETIFVRRGLGSTLLAAINNQDYPVVQGVVGLSAAVYSVINALADVVYGMIDPRVTLTLRNGDED